MTQRDEPRRPAIAKRVRFRVRDPISCHGLPASSPIEQCSDFRLGQLPVPAIDSEHQLMSLERWPVKCWKAHGTQRQPRTSLAYGRDECIISLPGQMHPPAPPTWRYRSRSDCSLACKGFLLSAACYQERGGSLPRSSLNSAIPQVRWTSATVWPANRGSSLGAAPARGGQAVDRV